MAATSTARSRSAGGWISIVSPFDNGCQNRECPRGMDWGLWIVLIPLLSILQDRGHQAEWADAEKESPCAGDINPIRAVPLRWSKDTDAGVVPMEARSRCHPAGKISLAILRGTPPKNITMFICSAIQSGYDTVQAASAKIWLEATSTG
jgi:hypothetical protein